MDTVCLEKLPIFMLARSNLDNEMLYRNHLCPEYEGCLGTAARQNFLLDCGACPLHAARSKQPVLTEPDVCGCKALLRAIFLSR